MQLVNLPEPIEMRCYSCDKRVLHAPVVINENVRYQCTTCGDIKLSSRETVKRELDREWLP